MRRADGILTEITPEYLEEWIPTQKGFGIYGPCPACRDKGLRWHPNGTWSWTKKEPNQVVCKTCKTVFPNEKYPETIHIRSKWDPNQVFSYCGGVMYPAENTQATRMIPRETYVSHFFIVRLLLSFCEGRR